jgi:hypothetical protein
MIHHVKTLTGFVDIEGVHFLGVGTGSKHVRSSPHLVPHNPPLPPGHLRHAPRTPQLMNCNTMTVPPVPPVTDGRRVRGKQISEIPQFSSRQGLYAFSANTALLLPLPLNRIGRRKKGESASNRILKNGTALIGTEPISGRMFVPSDSFQRQVVQLLEVFL